MAQKRDIAKKLMNEELVKVVNNKMVYDHYMKRVQMELQRDLMRVINLLNEDILPALNKNFENQN